METFEELWKYSIANNRICPNPDKWNDLFQMLKNKKQKNSGGWEPSLPLILAAWYDTPALSKQLRFQEHIKWAFDNQQSDEVINFIKSLKEEEWFHLGD